MLKNEEQNLNVSDCARLLRGRVMRAYLKKAFLTAVSCVLPFISVAVLALRFLGTGYSLPLLALVSFIPVAVAFAVLACMSAKKLPSEKSCVAAIDSASSAGGLMMTDAASAGWKYPEVVLPEIRTDLSRQLPFALCSLLFFAAVFALPESFFARMNPKTAPVLAPLAEKELEKLRELEDEGLVDRETAGEMKEWLEKAAADDASSESMNELLESLDHIAAQLDSAEAKDVEAAVSESEAIAAAENMADVLSDALKAGFDESEIFKAAEMMKDFIARSGMSEAMKSNILANASSGGMTAAELQKLAESLAFCSNISSNKILKLCEAGKLSPSQCGNCCGSCTNSAAANLAQLAQGGGEGSDAAAAACAVTVPGGAAPTRGPGAAELTFGEESDASGAKFKDETLSPYYSPGENNAKLQRVIYSDPSRPGAPAAVRQGELKESGDSGGKTRRDSVLPRHRQAVDKYFGE